MNDKFFIDSNIILYGFSKDLFKKEIVKTLIRANPLISIQVVNEIINVLLKKFHFSIKDVKEVLNFLKLKTKITNLKLESIELALFIKEKYKYSYYDSLIIASALENDCTILYSEDMQHTQVIEGKLKIINPFKQQKL